MSSLARTPAASPAHPAQPERAPRGYAGDPLARGVSMWSRARADRPRSPMPAAAPPLPPDPEATLPLYIPTRPPGSPAAVLE